MFDDRASAIRQVGAIIFETAPSMVEIKNLGGDIWTIEKNGAHVYGYLSFDGSKFSFVVDKGSQELVKKKYTV